MSARTIGNAFVSRRYDGNAHFQVFPDGRAYSYGVLIATHHDDSEVWVTTAKYSKTTTTHTNAIRNALAADGYQRTGTVSTGTGTWDVYRFR